jgi:hypothetical protein
MPPDGSHYPTPHTAPVLPDPGLPSLPVGGVKADRRSPGGLGLDAADGERDHPAIAGRTAPLVECPMCGHDFDPDYSPELDVCQPCAEITQTTR